MILIFLSWWCRILYRRENYGILNLACVKIQMSYTKAWILCLEYQLLSIVSWIGFKEKKCQANTARPHVWSWVPHIRQCMIWSSCFGHRDATTDFLFCWRRRISSLCLVHRDEFSLLAFFAETQLQWLSVARDRTYPVFLLSSPSFISLLISFTKMHPVIRDNLFKITDYECRQLSHWCLHANSCMFLPKEKRPRFGPTET